MDRLIRISKSVVPDTNVSREAYSLKYIDTGVLSTSEISLIQARNEITSYSEIVLNMFDDTRSLLKPEKGMDIEAKFIAIQDIEAVTDSIEQEISNYLTRASQNRLSPEGSLKVKSMIAIISYIEDIADCCYKIAVIFKRKNENMVYFQPFMMDNIELMFNLVYEALNILDTNLKTESSNLNVQRAGYIKNEISSFRNQVRSEHYSNLEKHTYDFKTGSLYNDIFSECDKIGDFSIRISESIAGSNIRA